MVVCHGLLQAPKEISDVLPSYAPRDIQGLAESYLLSKARRKEVRHSVMASLPTLFMCSISCFYIGSFDVQVQRFAFFEIS